MRAAKQNTEFYKYAQGPYTLALLPGGMTCCDTSMQLVCAIWFLVCAFTTCWRGLKCVGLPYATAWLLQPHCRLSGLGHSGGLGRPLAALCATYLNQSVSPITEALAPFVMLPPTAPTLIARLPRIMSCTNLRSLKFEPVYTRAFCTCGKGSV